MKNLLVRIHLDVSVLLLGESPYGPMMFDISTGISIRNPL